MLILEMEEDFMKKQKLFSSAKGCTKLYKNKELNIMKTGSGKYKVKKQHMYFQLQSGRGVCRCFTTAQKPEYCSILKNYD